MQNREEKINMKRINKIMCTAIAAAMIVSSASAIPTFAAEKAAVSSSVSADNKNGDYKKVLSIVKSKVSVPDNLTEFDMNTSADKDGNVHYYFSWHTGEEEKYSNANMSVGADADGAITDYYYYDSDKIKEKSGVVIADMSKDEVKKQIEEQLKTLIPEKFDKLKIEGKTESNGNEYNIQYYRVENGIRVYDNYVNVSAVISDGKALLRHISSRWDSGEFTAAENAMSVEDASKLYMDKARFCLNYGTFYKSRDKYDTFLRYSFKNNVFIDAVTGDVIEDDGYISYRTSNSAMGATKEAAADMEAGFTPAEEKELAKAEGLISYSDAEKKIRSIKELEISSDMKVSEKIINKSGDEYRMTLNFSDENGTKYANITINAQNGDLYSGGRVREYDGRKEDNKPEITEEQKQNAVKKITEFVQKYSPEYYKSTAPAEPNTVDGTVSVMFERVYEGIPVGYDGITVTWNAYDDTFSYINTHKSNIDSFKPNKNIIDKNAAYEKALKEYGFEKMYIKNDGKIRTAYGIAKDSSNSVDAVTGDIVDGRGRKISSFDGYKDIGGHWAENIINTLADYNICSDSEFFKPDENITQRDLLKMLNTAKYSYAINDDDRLYQQFVRENIISENEIKPDSAVTKQQAVKYLLKMMDYANAAEIKGIFKCDFADSDAVDGDCFGYVAIAKGLGIVNGDESNSFNPEKNITNAEAAVIIYNYLKK